MIKDRKQRTPVFYLRTKTNKKEKPGRPAVSSVDPSIKIIIYKRLLKKCHMLQTKKILFKNF